MGFRIGDLVSRKSHHDDIMFKITEMCGEYAILKGSAIRLWADAPYEDLRLLTQAEIGRYRQTTARKANEVLVRLEQNRRQNVERFLSRAKINYKKELREPEVFELPGSVVHIDGDKEYLDLCMNTYRQVNMRANGFCITECEQANQVREILLEYMPDILVLTGHDGILKGRKNLSDPSSYRNSGHFARAVRKAREVMPGRDDLVIFAGACQSHYESLIKAGSNFASSPRRVLIHAYDPVFIAEKVAYTPFYQLVNIKEAIHDTITGTDGLGGIETHGRLRLGYPKSPY